MKGRREALTIVQILEWADLHHLRVGAWPTSRSGRILDFPERTWESVQTALIKGTCGLPGGGSLHRLLAARRRIKDPRVVVPDLTFREVKSLVDSHFARTGCWPRREDGPVVDCPQISWSTIDRRMRRGELSLPRGTTLAKWLRDARSVWHGGKPKLTERLVLRWAERHYARFGRWPVTMSGPMYDHPGENWAAIDVGLRNARRGFPYRTSLSRLLRKHFGDRYDKHIGSPKGKRPGSLPRRITVRRSGVRHRS